MRICVCLCVCVGGGGGGGGLKVSKISQIKTIPTTIASLDSFEGGIISVESV